MARGRSRPRAAVGAPAQLARVHAGTTLGAWCGQECAMGRRARDLPLGEEVVIWTAKSSRSAPGLSVVGRSPGGWCTSPQVRP